jgi:hypothetical protein
MQSIFQNKKVCFWVQTTPLAAKVPSSEQIDFNIFRRGSSRAAPTKYHNVSISKLMHFIRCLPAIARFKKCMYSLVGDVGK